MAQATKPAPSSSTASSETNLYATLLAYLRGKGFTMAKAQQGAAAFLGNFKIESGFSPTAYNPRENAHGYAQWENGRWTSLQSYAAAHHMGATTDQAERGFLLQELNGPYRSVVDSLRTAPNIDAATQIVQSRFEGSTPDSLGARQSAARSIYADIVAGRPLRGGPLSSTAIVPSSSGGAAGFTAGSSSSGGASFFGLSGLSNWVSALVEHSIFIVGGLILFIVGVVIIAKSAGVDVHTLDGTPAEPAQNAGKSAHHSAEKLAAAAAV